ncbi:hypothetical protein ONZ45_g10287 [Pleurotus djamor]|nr:hypothetical protein ONZ45_g10287 [Pleurotus djamor]
MLRGIQPLGEDDAIPLPFPLNTSPIHHLPHPTRIHLPNQPQPRGFAVFHAFEFVDSISNRSEWREWVLGRKYGVASIDRDVSDKDTHSLHPLHAFLSHLPSPPPQTSSPRPSQAPPRLHSHKTTSSVNHPIPPTHSISTEEVLSGAGCVFLHVYLDFPSSSIPSSSSSTTTASSSSSSPFYFHPLLFLIPFETWGRSRWGSEETPPRRPLQNHLPATEVPRARGTRILEELARRRRGSMKGYIPIVFIVRNDLIPRSTRVLQLRILEKGGKYIEEEGKDGKVKEDEDKKDKEERIPFFVGVFLPSHTSISSHHSLSSHTGAGRGGFYNSHAQCDEWEWGLRLYEPCRALLRVSSPLPTPHSSQSNPLNSFASSLDGNENANAIANASFCSSGNGVVYSGNGYGGMYRFDQGLDAFSVASTGMGIMDVDIGSVFANNSSSLNSPSSNSVANANDADADDANGQPSEAEMGRLTHILLFVVNRVYAG